MDKATFGAYPADNVSGENMKSVKIEPQKIEAGVKAQKASVGKDFAPFLGAADAMAPFAGQTTYFASGSPGAATVLQSAFTGVPAAAAAFSGAQYAGGWGGSGGFGAYAEYPGMFGVGKYSGVGTTTGGLPGDSTVDQATLMNTMNQNNLKLLELQAVMQSNMQAWNTKSNILSADHRARMSMIEKFTARA